ncbi:Protein MAK11 [Nakaseomyces bracarensis]|uniref:Protein MAK11 n=1 Tax=Nakaseomyces bracarensis TaxID=273131 RepID=A0ABR4NYG8_9SACH
MARNQFRIIVGSYEHNLLCLSIDLTLETPVFTPIFHFQAHSLSVKCLDVSKRYLVSGSNDEHIRIYDLQKRKELGTLLAHQGSITNLQFSKATAEVTDNKGSGKWLLSASDDNKIIVWRVKDWENFGTLKGHTARINDMDIHPSNRVVASVSDDHSIRLWNLMTVKKAAVLKLKKYNQNGQFVRWLKPDGKYFAVALMTKVIIYDTATAKVFKEVDTGKKTIMHMEIVTLDDNEYIVVGLGDGNVNFYKLNEILESNDVEFNEKPEFSLLGHTNRVKDLKFYKNEFGTYMVTVGSDGKVIVWDMEKKDQIAVYDCGERLNCLTLCDESIEKADTMRKRTLDQTELGEQSEVESDTEELKKVMFGNKKKSKKSKKNKKAKKVEVQLE